jgi:hypothetical protein
MDTRIEDAMASIEGAASPVYERLAKGIMPRGSDREVFGHFLGLLYMRSPSFRRMTAEIHKVGLESMMAVTAQHPASFEGAIERMRAAGHEVSDPVALRRAMRDMSDRELLLDKSWVLSALKAIPEFALVFLKMKWSLGRAQHHYFITNDTPIHLAVSEDSMHPFYGGYGLGNPTAVIGFPVSRERILVLNWKLEAPYEVEITRDLVKVENKKRASSAERQVYAHIYHKGLERLVMKHKGDRMRMEANTLADKGFRRVRVPRRWPKN